MQSAIRSQIHDAAVKLFAERSASDLSVSELAQAAGVARGTIYKNVARSEDLFTEVASELTREMHARVFSSMTGVDDPARRLAMGLRMFVRRAHAEPTWGRFVVRFALHDSVMREMMDLPPSIDIARGIEAGRYKVDAAQIKAIVSLVGGAGVSAMISVLDGHQTWRDAGANVAELVLRALGIPQKEARVIAAIELPPLEALPR